MKLRSRRIPIGYATPQRIPKGHLAYFISDTVDALDLSAMMVKVLVYGYATGVFSSRKIERRQHEDLAFRMLGARNFPRHRTIRDFRALHLKELSDLFVQVVRLAREMGRVKLGTVAIDGNGCAASARTSASNSNTCPRTSRSSATCGRSWRA